MKSASLDADLRIYFGWLANMLEAGYIPDETELTTTVKVGGLPLDGTRRLLEILGYAASDVATQYPVRQGSSTKKADFRVGHDEANWMLELKEPGTSCSGGPGEQLQSYMSADSKLVPPGPTLGLVFNGREVHAYLNFDHPKLKGLGNKWASEPIAVAKISDLDAVVELIRPLASPCRDLVGFARHLERVWQERRQQDQLNLERQARIAAAVAQIRTKPSARQCEAIVQATPELDDLNVAADEFARTWSSSPPSGSSEKRVGVGFMTLTQLRGKVTHQKPAMLRYPEGKEEAVAAWRDVAASVVQWLASTKNLEYTGHRALSKGRRYYVNTEPKHPNGSAMRSHMVIEHRSGPLYLDLNRSARAVTTCLTSLCIECGVDPNNVKICLAR